MTKKNSSYNSWIIRNTNIIFLSEWLVYVISLFVIALRQQTMPTIESQKYLESYLSFHYLIFLPLLILFIIIHIFRIHSLQNKNLLFGILSTSSTVKKIQLIWIVLVFVMLYFSLRSLLIMLVMFGFNPCDYNWRYCIKQYFSK